MKKTVSLILTLCLLIPCLALPVGADSVYQPDVRVVYAEDHKQNTTLELLTAGNKTETYDGKSPLGNLYDQKVVGTGYTEFSNQFAVTGKKLAIQGNHASETTSKNVFSMSNDLNANAGKGFLTVVPKEAVAGLDNFTVNYLERQYEPNGTFGLALFYRNAVTENGIDYFGGYDNYSFTGFTGTKFDTYTAFTLQNGTKTEATCAEMTTKPAKNKSVFVSVKCTKGSWEVNNTTYTAKMESYVDDYLIATSYGQWADAPIMFYYETPADSRWDVQFTNIEVTTENAHLDPGSGKDTGVVYKGCQESIGTANGKFSVRFVATVESLEYSAVGFEIQAVYEAGDIASKTYGKPMTSVCTGLLATSGDNTTVLVNAEALGGNYLMAYSVNSIPLSVGTATFTVTPWYELAGVRTRGTSYTVIYRNGVLVSQTAVPVI